MAMSSSTGTRKVRDVQSRASEAIIESDRELINSFKIFAESTNATAGLAGAAVNNSPKTPAGNYLAREGDSMIGPLALGPPLDFTVEIDTNNTIDIGPLSENVQYSSNIQLDSVQPNSFILNIIANAAFDGQVLIMRTFGPDSFTINQGTLGNGGNIQTPDGANFTLEALQMIILVFDEALLIGANTGGTWRILSGAGSGGSTGTGTFISAALSVDQITNLAVNDHVEFDTNTPPTGADGEIVLQTGAGQANGIFELLAGKTYFLSAAVAPFFGAANDIDLVWFDITNTTEIGVRTRYSDAVLAMNQPKAEIIFTPLTDVNVEFRLVAATTPANLNGYDSDHTFASIFEFSGQAGAPGADGAPTWKLPARSKSTADVPNLAVFTVDNDGVILVEGDRVLLTNQVTLSENGLYQVGVVAAGLAPLTRPTDFDTNDEVLAETFVAIEEGNQFANQLYHLISNNPLLIDSSDQVWEQFAPGISGGPDLGAGEDGVDNAGEWVYDGRVFGGNHITKRWESGTSHDDPRGVEDINWLPGNGENTFGRLFVMGGSNMSTIPSGVYSDDMGDTWTGSTGFTGSDLFVRSAYDPVGNVLVAVSQIGGVTRKIKRSLNRGTDFIQVTVPNTQNHTDVLWSANDSIFVAPSFPGNTIGIQTSTDGASWASQTTPTPLDNNLANWSYIAYSASQDLYVCTTGQDTDVMTASDPTGTWTAHLTNIDLGVHQRIIYSPGRDEFVIVGRTSATELNSWVSQDGINWEKFTVDTFGTGVITAAVTGLVGGSGYTQGQTVGLTGQTSGATNGFATVNVTAGAVTAVIIAGNDGTGTGYQSGETLNIVGGNNDATVTATVVVTTSSFLNDVVWAPELSLYVAVGGTNYPPADLAPKWWVSQDAKTWTVVPRSIDSQTTAFMQGVTWAPEYGNFVSIAGTVSLAVFRTFR
jgi:hypothetical protein